MRGNRPARPSLRTSPGSIPACAGEPGTRCLRSSPSRVYPRVCGGTSYLPDYGTTLRGLSPRVRGNRGGAGQRVGTSGSIPACAGEPRPAAGLPRMLPVYPRVCGGTWWTMTPSLPCLGLSPRVRGNHITRRAVGVDLRSIPACAGEPCRRYSALGGVAVYPRVCGGTLL